MMKGDLMTDDDKAVVEEAKGIAFEKASTYIAMTADMLV